MARANRLASLSTLAAGLAHEVSNPLTAAVLQLDVLERRVLSRRCRFTRGSEVLERVKELRNTHEQNHRGRAPTFRRIRALI